jgi:hypothetical protein
MKKEMEPGKIYFLRFSGVEIVGRFKNEDVVHYYFYDCLHNWSGYESFRIDTYTVKNVDEIREATDTEKQSLLRQSISNKTI